MVTASLPLFYQSVVPLDRREHARLRVRPSDNFLFTADAALVPLLTAEFGLACREYPIAFMRESTTSEVFPVVLTGMPQGKNLFVDASGRWQARYLPAYVRRYPFAFIEATPENCTVCIDPTSRCFDETEGEPLFGADGEPSNTLKDLIKALSDYQGMMRATRTFMSRLAAANILMEANAKADLPDGRSLLWSGFWVVEEAKFRQLPEGTLKDWFSTGELGLIYAHLLSLGNLSELMRRQTNGAVQQVKSL
jgi:hypothetical protein